MNYLRTMLIVIFSITVTTLLAQAPWTRITPTPQENTINDITRIPGTERLVAVGGGSTIMMSDDAGETWVILLNPAGMDNSFMCNGIHFINETTGFINGTDWVILKTIDGGLTWSKKNIENPGSGLPLIHDIEFLNEMHGFAAVDGGHLFETTDAGETWHPVDTGIGNSLEQIVFADSLTGFIFSWDMNCLKTTDGGISWNWEVLSDELPQGFVYDCYFTNATTGFVFIMVNTPDNCGYIYKTTDGGLTWNLEYSDVSAYSGKFAFFNDQQGMVACATWMYQTKILLTNDGGLSWTEISEPWVPWGAANSMIYTSQLNAIMLGYKGMIFKTNDGGLSWQPKQNRLFSGEIFEAQFLNENIGYTLNDAGGGGVGGIGIKKTVDGGNNWNYIYTNYWSYDLDFYFLTADTGWAVTESFNDTISFLTTTDGGENWTEITTGYEFTPTDIKFIDENNGLICGEYLVIKTSDGGLTWEEVTPGNIFGAECYQIKYRSSNEVFMAGSENYPATTVFHSTDGGETWQTISIGYYGPAEDIALPDENTIMIITGIEIFKSDDNGLTWNQSTSTNPNFLYFNSLHFTSPTIGYAMGFGEFANIEKTTDGGDTWFPLETKITSGLNAACFFNDEEGLVFGDKGVMIRTTTGGVTGTNDQAISETDNYFTASPNPFTEEIIIRPVVGNIVVYPVLVVLTDLGGRQVLEKQIANADNDIRLSGESLKPGVYICRISNRDGITETLKLVKIKQP
jgi:photosystem II stability/assembly factor-like uncharacterized protein